jgi:hypothetical protein
MPSRTLSDHAITCGGRVRFHPHEPAWYARAHERESHPRPACRSASDALASTMTWCLSRNRSARWANAVALAGTRLYAPAQSVNSSTHARFALPSPVREADQELRDHVRVELAPKELRLGVRVAVLALDTSASTLNAAHPLPDGGRADVHGEGFASREDIEAGI